MGTIYTTSSKKIAEHGGGSEDERHVGCFAHNPKLSKESFNDRVNTEQVGATTVSVLGFKKNSLKGVDQEGTDVLPGF